jgi:hypothetical protein
MAKRDEAMLVKAASALYFAGKQSDPQIAAQARREPTSRAGGGEGSQRDAMRRR